MRLILVSNRLPVNIIKDNDSYRYEKSSGGLASGMRAYVEQIQKNKSSKIKIEWIGWPGSSVDNEEKVKKEISKKFNAHCVFLSSEQMENFYEGFCNKTIWPLFHYFPVYTSYLKENWEHYISVNETYCQSVLAVIKPGDIIWIHDYHLMLLPALLRKKVPDATIGFFLHIPFPSYEVFRLLPNQWRKQILQGLYGADLIGFHTHDYQTYFLRSTLRILGLNNHMCEVSYNNRLVKMDNFPMGIDYNKYHAAATSSVVEIEKKQLQNNFPSVKIILSIDRQDYTKGILNRLKGFECFLKTYPLWIEKVTLIMTIVPSRIGGESYQNIKSQIDELVGHINGKYGTLSWTPVVYQYRSLSFSELIALYNSADVALITPLRDGMNLVSKEFIASRTNNKGVLILSEMAGAADELAESILINPNNIEEIADAIANALELNEQEQESRLHTMQTRIKEYDLFKWADDFLNSLQAVKEKQQRLSARMFNNDDRKKIISEFKHASSRTIFLDYDGTLTPFTGHHQDAIPSSELLNLIKKLSLLKNTNLIIISGRGRHILSKWFAHLPLNLVAEHGLFIKEKGKKWRLIKPIRNSWKKKIIPILNLYVNKLPASFLEEKEYSLVFHYRKSEPSLASLRVKQLTDYLVNYTSNMDVQVFNANKAIEIRNAGIDKGVAAMYWLPKKKINSDFVLSVGDDLTDEALFRVMQKGHFSIKVGLQPSYAKYNLQNSEQVIQILNDLELSLH